MPERTCENDGCHETITYGVEERITTRYCCFECRDEDENRGVYMTAEQAEGRRRRRQRRGW